MLIDEFVPRYDFRSRHQAMVPAPAEVVRQALQEWRPETSFPWRLLLRLRGLGRPRGSLREWAEATGFLRLGETDDELVYGQIGRFWAAQERAALVSPRTAEEFRRFADPGYAVAAVSIRVEPLSAARARLSTETRIRALGPQARLRFRLYWLLIRPFSGLLRRAMLNGVRAGAIARYKARAQQPQERSA